MRPTRVLTRKPDGELRIHAARGLDYWERLSQGHRWRAGQEDRDHFLVAMLKPLGIEKGTPLWPARTAFRQDLEAG
jgi:hypothetical protein